MKCEVKDKSINIIVEEAVRLKEISKEYYASENQEEIDELLKALSWSRNNLNSKLDLLLETDIISMDEWVIAYRLITRLL